MKTMLSAIAAIGLLVATSPAAAAYCFEPKAPSLLFISKPRKPYCATDRSCEQWEVDSYKRDVSRYYNQLEEYLSSVNRFSKQAGEYAECMADLD